jgi:hypothetical protein
MEKVLITGLLVTASVITVMILFGVFRTSIQESAGSATGLQDQASLQAETGITIMEVIAVDNGTVFDIWAKNIGSAEIVPIENLVLSIMDINGTSYEYIENGPSDPLKRTWQLVRGDSRWLPGETLQLRGKLFLSPATSEEYILSIDTLSDSSVADFSGAFVFNAIPNRPVTPQPTIVATATPTPAPGPTPTPGPTSTPIPTPIPVSGSCTATEPSGSGLSLNSIEMSTGYPRQLLSVNGDTTDASVIWAAGTPNAETAIVTGQGGTRYFQIPTTAGPGIYPVALRTAAGGTSNIRCVTVKPASGVFPDPRVEDIGLNGRTGNDLAVTVSAANLDQDATMTVNGTLVAGSYLSSGLPVPYLLNHIPATYGYPIYHYGQLKGVVQNVTLGSTLNVVVTNNDGNTSTKSYTLPNRWEDLDSDSDGLLDRWEDGIYTAPGGGTVNLAAMGVNKYKKDILMETDWIAATAPGSAGVGYDNTIFTIASDFFARGPVLNPDGTRGINLISDHGQGGAFTGGGTVLTPDHERMDYDTCPSQPCSNFVTFMTYKNSSFATERNGLFHYLILGKKTGDGSGGGEARFPFSPPSAGCPECGGDNLFVNFPSMPSSEFAAVIVHEMGHDIGLAHGGIWPNPDHQNWKPNFHSIMNYRYTTSGVPPGCDLTGVDETNYRGGGPSTFSSGTLLVIRESFVDENLGVCDRSPSDLSGDGQWPNRPNGITAGPMNVRGAIYTNWPTTHTDFDQWGNLVLDFAACWPNPQGLVRRATCE